MTSLEGHFALHFKLLSRSFSQSKAFNLCQTEKSKWQGKEPPWFPDSKLAMQERGYNQVYTGGLSSFSIVLMTAGHLRAEARNSGEGSCHAAPASLGRLLLAFFDRYGNFNCSLQAISMARVSTMTLMASDSFAVECSTDIEKWTRGYQERWKHSIKLWSLSASRTLPAFLLEVSS